MGKGDNWVVTRLMGETGACELRVARLSEGFSFKEFSDRVHILWGFEGGARSTPDATEEAAMAEFEAGLVDMLARTGLGALVMVLTEAGHREYVLHAREEGPVIDHLNTLDHGLLPLLDIQAESDSTGAFFFAHAGHLVRKTA